MCAHNANKQPVRLPGGLLHFFWPQVFVRAAAAAHRFSVGACMHDSLPQGYKEYYV
jgi:hypothetical protein